MLTPIQKLAIGGAVVAVGLLAAYWTLLFLAQRSILFPVPPLTGAPPRPSFAQQLWLTTSFGRVEAWFLPPLRAQNSRAPLLLFTHGNAELIDHWPEEFEQPRQAGMAALLVEYPGYGRSDGSPSEVSITEAMMAAYDWAQHQAHIDSSRIIPYGRSLGGGAAAIVAAKRAVRALILESAPSSIAAFASGFGAPRFLVRDPFDSVAALGAIRTPILILHGERDDIVPADDARVLASAGANAIVRYLPCGHNDCPRPWDEVLNFLRNHQLI